MSYFGETTTPKGQVEGSIPFWGAKSVPVTRPGLGSLRPLGRCQKHQSWHLQTQGK